MKNNKNVFKLAPFIISFIFLFNPNITVIDVLPDFIGYIFLCYGSYRLSDLNENICEAYKIFKKMIFIDAAKIIAILWIFGMTVLGERNTSILLWTFVFSVIELIFLIPAYIKLFNGIIGLGYRFPNDSIFGKNKKSVGFVKILSIVFVSIKAVLGVLPEFADLTSRTYDDSFGTNIPVLYDYIGIMRLFAFIPVLSIGCVWLVFIIRFFVLLNKDMTLRKSLNEKYRSDITPKTGMFIKRNFNTVVILLIMAVCATADIRIKNVNVLPDIFSAILFAVALWFLQKDIAVKIKSWIYSVATYFFASTVSFLIEWNFFNDYYYGAIIKSENAKILYIILVVAEILKALSFCIVLFDLTKMLFKEINKHTGFVLGAASRGHGENLMISSQQRELKKYVIFADIAAAISIIADICYVIYAPDFGFMGLISFVGAVFCVFMFGKALFAIQSAVNTKYMLE